MLRYIRRKHVDGEKNLIDGAGFLPRPNEAAPSVNWMECFAPPTENQCNEICARRRIKYEKRGKLVRLNVGHTRNHVQTNAPSQVQVQLNFIHEPLVLRRALTSMIPSHAEINGMPGLRRRPISLEIYLLNALPNNGMSFQTEQLFSSMSLLDPEAAPVI